MHQPAQGKDGGGGHGKGPEEVAGKKGGVGKRDREMEKGEGEREKGKRGQ